MVEFNRPDVRERVRIGLRIAEQFGLDVNETIQLTVPIADMVNPNLFTGFPKGCWGRKALGPPGAGDVAMIGLQSAPDRGIVYHVTQLLIVGIITGRVNIRVDNSDISGTTNFDTSPTKRFTDARDNGLPDIVLWSAAPLVAGAIGTVTEVLDLSDFKQTVIPVDVVLGELGFIAIQNATENEGIDVSFRWTEYLLEDR